MNNLNQADYEANFFFIDRYMFCDNVLEDVI